MLQGHRRFLAGASQLLAAAPAIVIQNLTCGSARERIVAKKSLMDKFKEFVASTESNVPMTGREIAKTKAKKKAKTSAVKRATASNKKGARTIKKSMKRRSRKKSKKAGKKSVR